MSSPSQEFFALDPEVPGGFGEGTQLDRSQVPIRVTHLVLEFEGWLGDELITSFPAYAVTAGLGERLTAAGLTGISLREMEQSRSEEFLERWPDRELPQFRELLVTGVAGSDDFGIDATQHLVVSRRALDVIEQTEPLDLDVSPWTQPS
jgi:hypothetical protein